MLSLFPKYRIGRPIIEALRRNEPDRWAVAADELAQRNKTLGRSKFTDDQMERLTGLAVLVDVGVIKRTFPAKSQPVEAAVGEPDASE